MKSHLLPLPNPKQALSLVFVEDLAEAVVRFLETCSVAGQTFYISHAEIANARMLGLAIAEALSTWTIPCPLPITALWPVCLVSELKARLTGNPEILSLQKYPELGAAAWTCDPSEMQRQLGYICATDLKTGIAQTLAWYRRVKWI